MLNHIAKATGFPLQMCGKPARSALWSSWTTHSVSKLAPLVAIDHGAARLLHDLPGGTRGLSTSGTVAAVSRDTDVLHGRVEQQDQFWKTTSVWANTSAEDFLSYRWSVSST
jgi:hypothetical protein